MHVLASKRATMAQRATSKAANDTAKLCRIKSTKSASTDDLTERRELSKTRIMVMEKQETRLRESLKEQDAKISEMVSGKKDPNSPPPQSKT